MNFKKSKFEFGKNNKLKLFSFFFLVCLFIVLIWLSAYNSLNQSVTHKFSLTSPVYTSLWRTSSSPWSLTIHAVVVTLPSVSSRHKHCHDKLLHHLLIGAQVRAFLRSDEAGYRYVSWSACSYPCVRMRWRAWVCMRADRGVHDDSLCNGGEGNLLRRILLCGCLHISLWSSFSLRCVSCKSSSSTLSFLTSSISHHLSCLMFLLLHSSLPPPFCHVWALIHQT